MISSCSKINGWIPLAFILFASVESMAGGPASQLSPVEEPTHSCVPLITVKLGDSLGEIQRKVQCVDEGEEKHLGIRVYTQVTFVGPVNFKYDSVDFPVILDENIAVEVVFNMDKEKEAGRGVNYTGGEYAEYIGVRTKIQESNIAVAAESLFLLGESFRQFGFDQVVVSNQKTLEEAIKRLDNNKNGLYPHLHIDAWRNDYIGIKLALVRSRNNTGEFRYNVAFFIRDLRKNAFGWEEVD